MRPALLAGLLYFAGVFAIGFLLGGFRILWLAPRLGETAAVLLELPAMLGASWWWCGLLLRRLAVPRRAADALVMGALAFALLMAAEFALGAATGSPAAAQVAKWGTLAGALGLLGQIVFAIIPFAQIRGVRNRDWRNRE